MKNRKILFFCLFINSVLLYGQAKIKDSFVLNTKEKKPYIFSVVSNTEPQLKPTDTLIVKFTFSLLGENENEGLNENFYSFKMKYTKQNCLMASQALPENIVSKLAINSGTFPPSYEIFVKDRITKNMNLIFRQIESDLKLKKIGKFE
ncbi:MAG: hypothetical protein ACK48W_02655 [Bacteroidota bacterium]